MPRLSLPPRTNSAPLACEQQEWSSGDEAEEQFDYSEDEEPDEENQSDNKALEERSERNEDPKLRADQSDDLTAANCLSIENYFLMCSLIKKENYYLF